MPGLKVIRSAFYDWLKKPELQPCVAHRPETIAVADRILELKQVQLFDITTEFKKNRASN